MHGADVAQQGLIDRASEGELEVGVVTQLQVGKVLVREGLQYHRGHLGQARFAVVAVPHAAHRPGLSRVGREVALQPCEHRVVQVAAAVAAGSGSQAGVVEGGGVDAQRAYEGIVLGVSGIAVYAQAQFQRHSQSLLHGVVDGAS